MQIWKERHVTSHSSAKEKEAHRKKNPNNRTILEFQKRETNWKDLIIPTQNQNGFT